MGVDMLIKVLKGKKVSSVDIYTSGWDVRVGYPGQNIDIHEAYNWNGMVYVQMEDMNTKQPAIANFWSIGTLGQIEKHGTHTGFFQLRVKGLSDRLRAGHILTPTNFYISAKSGAIVNVQSTFPGGDAVFKLFENDWKSINYDDE